MITSCIDPSRVTAFTGHRDLPWGRNELNPLCISVKHQISTAIIRLIGEGSTTFLCGLALGADTLFAEEVVRQRESGHHIQLIGAIPSEKQPSRWKPDDQTHYYHLRDLCDDLYIHDPDDSMPFARACLARNDWMLENASTLIALYDGRGRGGTAHTVSYARRIGMPVVVIDPNAK